MGCSAGREAAQSRGTGLESVKKHIETNFNVAQNAIPHILIVLVLSALSWLAHAAEPVLRVAVLNHSPPMSYTDPAGKLTGFNVEIMHALCEAMNARCEPVSVTLERVVDAVAAGEFDFAAVSLLATPERRARVLMTRPYYRSISVWFARPGVRPGAGRVALVKGGVQYRYGTAHAWSVIPVENHDGIATALHQGSADATLLPMATALALQQDPRIRGLGLTTAVLRDPELAGDVCLSVNPRSPELADKLNEAIDLIKRDGRFDRINSRFIPFRLQ